jgi:hypothetical protein
MGSLAGELKRREAAARAEADQLRSLMAVPPWQAGLEPRSPANANAASGCMNTTLPCLWPRGRSLQRGTVFFGYPSVEYRMFADPVDGLRLSPWPARVVVDATPIAAGECNDNIGQVPLGHDFSQDGKKWFIVTLREASG